MKGIVNLAEDQQPEQGQRDRLRYLGKIDRPEEETVIHDQFDI